MDERKIEWSREARTDLYEILDYYYRRNGTIVYSKNLNTKINKTINFLKKNPYLGVKSEDYDFVRVLNTGDYQIVYEIFDTLILIIMIWDCRRDPDDKIIENRIKK